MEPQQELERVQYLTFRSAGRSHALPVLKVREILPFAGATPIPLAPREIRGLINLRGSAVPVLDLAIRLGHAPTADGRRTCVVILDEGGHGAQRMGLLTEEVEFVVALDPRELAPPPRFGDGAGPGLVESMAYVGEHFVPILAVEKLFAWGAEAALAALPAETERPDAAALESSLEREETRGPDDDGAVSGEADSARAADPDAASPRPATGRKRRERRS